VYRSVNVLGVGVCYPLRWWLRDCGCLPTTRLPCLTRTFVVTCVCLFNGCVTLTLTISQLRYVTLVYVWTLLPVARHTRTVAHTVVFGCPDGCGLTLPWRLPVVIPFYLRCTITTFVTAVPRLTDVCYDLPLINVLFDCTRLTRLWYVCSRLFGTVTWRVDVCVWHCCYPTVCLTTDITLDCCDWLL